MNLKTGFALPIAGMLALSACVGTELEDTVGMTPSGDAFDTALYQGYVAQSQHEYGYGGYTSSDVFAQKAQMAAKGETVLPFTPNDEGNYPPGVVPDNELGAMRDGRAALMAAMNAGARTVAPRDAATAQVSYDCWVEEQSYTGDWWEASQPAHAAECREAFESALARVQAALQPAQPQAQPAADVNSFLVFFDWDRANITSSALAVVREAVDNFRASGARMMQVIGHADTSGPSDYNMGLSQRRAQNAADALTSQGVPANQIEIDWRGEESPLIPTGDGIREPQNRRVEMRFEQ